MDLFILFFLSQVTITLTVLSVRGLQSWTETTEGRPEWKNERVSTPIFCSPCVSAANPENTQAALCSDILWWHSGNAALPS